MTDPQLYNITAILTTIRRLFYHNQGQARELIQAATTHQGTSQGLAGALSS